MRRQAKMTNRKGPGHPGPQGGMSGSGMPGSAGLPGSNAGMTTPNARGPGSMAMGAPQLHHHHAHPDGSDARQDDVSGMFHYH